MSGWSAAARAVSLIRQLRGTLVALLCGLCTSLTQPHTASRLQHWRSALECLCSQTMIYPSSYQWLRMLLRPVMSVGARHSSQHAAGGEGQRRPMVAGHRRPWAAAGQPGLAAAEQPLACSSKVWHLRGRSCLHQAAEGQAQCTAQPAAVRLPAKCLTGCASWLRVSFCMTLARDIPRTLRRCL